MRRTTGLAVGVLLGFLPLLPAQETEAEVRKKLTGTWSGYAVEGRGENPDRGPVKLELTISPDLIRAKQFKGKQAFDLGEGTYKLRLDGKPRHLDGDKKLDNPNRKQVWLGIYELNGDTLRWCVGKKARPSDFATGDGAFLLILKRKR